MADSFVLHILAEARLRVHYCDEPSDVVAKIFHRRLSHDGVLAGEELG
ncbi:hypothetical protein FM113_07725 [Leucobacter sp. 7(1)]|nr:hypothetical protein [Leucobacter sp. 7(1)]SJN09936.1 hypothetical protein FM113_07725 [Leucobacter sp. 7(1)]